MERVSWTPEGWEAEAGAAHPALDREGEQILYDRPDQNGYRHIYGYDREAFVTEPLSITENATGDRLDNHHPAISSDGRYIAYQEESYSSELRSATCAVHFYDQWEGRFARVPCPHELAGEAEYAPNFTDDGTAVQWFEERDRSTPTDATPRQEAILVVNPIKEPGTQ